MYYTYFLGLRSFAIFKTEVLWPRYGKLSSAIIARAVLDLVRTKGLRNCSDLGPLEYRTFGGACTGHDGEQGPCDNHVQVPECCLPRAFYGDENVFEEKA